MRERALGRFCFPQTSLYVIFMLCSRVPQQRAVFQALSKAQLGVQPGSGVARVRVVWASVQVKVLRGP